MNTYTCVANLCRDAEPLTLGTRECMKLRLADNTPGKQSITRYFDAIVSGPDLDVAGRLETGDQIVVTGTLQLTEYKAKKGKFKGQKVTAEQMPFAKIIQVTRSEKFFSGGSDDEPSDDSGVTNEGNQDPTGEPEQSDDLPF
jgi:single-stranded DNA-binding protein